MKTLMIAFTFLLVASICDAQIKPHTSIPLSSIHLKKANTSTPALKYGATKKDVLAAFGAPDSIQIMPWDDFDKNIDGYTYGNNLVYIDTGNQSLWGFKITDSNFDVVYNNSVINVGDDISTLSTIFPTSYQNKYSKTISVGLTFDNGVGYDYVFAFLFNPNTNKITSIRIAYV